MRRYKTAVTDYEGMQGLLDSHAEQGWLLFSVTPDTWRRMVSETSGMEQSPQVLRGRLNRPYPVENR